MPDQSQIGDAIRKPYWGVAAGGEPGLLPVGGEALDYLQGVIAEAAEGSLVMRRLLGVEYMDGPVPIGPVEVDKMDQPDEHGPMTTTYKMTVGAVITQDVTLEMADLAALERGWARPKLKPLTCAVRALARAEDQAILRCLMNEGTPGAPPEPARGVAHGLVSMSQSLRGKGYLAPLAAVYSLDRPATTDAVPLPALGDTDSLRRLFPGGLYEMEVLPDNGIAVMLESGAGSPRVLVGRNYDLRWLGQVGEAHAFRLSVGIATVVDDPATVVVWKR